MLLVVEIKFLMQLLLAAAVQEEHVLVAVEEPEVIEKEKIHPKIHTQLHQ
jgi:hypothetical protein